MMGEEIDGDFLDVVSTRYGVGLYQLCTTIRNRASVNNMAVRAINPVLYSHLLDVGCFSYTIDHVGEHFKTPVLTPFMNSWVNLLAIVQKLAFFRSSRLVIHVHLLSHLMME